MALPPTTPTSSWPGNPSTPSRLFGTGRDDSELYEQDGEFVLSVEMPGFDQDAIEVSWHGGRLHVAWESEGNTATSDRRTAGASGY
jgi:HSP20 family protein